MKLSFLPLTCLLAGVSARIGKSDGGGRSLQDLSEFQMGTLSLVHKFDDEGNCMRFHGELGGNARCSRMYSRPCSGIKEEQWAYNPAGYVYSTTSVGGYQGPDRNGWDDSECATEVETGEEGGCLMTWQKFTYDFKPGNTPAVAKCNATDPRKVVQFTDLGQIMVTEPGGGRRLCLAIAENANRGSRGVAWRLCEFTDPKLITWQFDPPVTEGIVEGVAFVPTSAPTPAPTSTPIATPEEEDSMGGDESDGDMDGDDGDMGGDKEESGVAGNATDTSEMDDAQPEGTIVDVVLNSRDHSSLLGAVMSAGLVDLLSSEGPFTVFAPDDDAFEAFEKETGLNLINQGWKAHLTDLLSYHVVVGEKIVSADLKEEEEIEMGNGEMSEITSLKPPMILEAKITGADMMAENGVVHAIDSVLLPMWVNTNVVEAAENLKDVFSTLSEMIVAGNLTGLLSEEGPYTVFAPTNEAFAALDSEQVDFLTSEDGKDALIDILSYHVSSGIVLSADVKDGDTITMINEMDATISVMKVEEDDSMMVAANATDTEEEAGDADTNEDGEAVSKKNAEDAMKKTVYKINDATITSGDILVNNGVIHVIDAVLIPEKEDTA